MDIIYSVCVYVYVLDREMQNNNNNDDAESDKEGGIFRSLRQKQLQRSTVPDGSISGGMGLYGSSIIPYVYTCTAYGVLNWLCSLYALLYHCCDLVSLSFCQSPGMDVSVTWYDPAWCNSFWLHSNSRSHRTGRDTMGCLETSFNQKLAIRRYFKLNS